MLKIVASFLLLIVSISAHSECLGVKIRDIYQVCNSNPPYEILNLKTSEKYIFKGEDWEVCSNLGDCGEKLVDERMKLYFNSAIAVENNKTASVLSLESFFENPCPNFEFNDSTKGMEKSKGEDSFFNLSQYFDRKIKEVKDLTAYHMRYFHNLENLVTEYEDNYKFIYEDTFEKSFEYDIYEKPGSYLSDLSSYKVQLLQAEQNLDWLFKKYDLNELNLSLNLKDNKRIAKLFNEFSEVTGFPDNLEDLRAIIKEKIAWTDNERKRMQVWLLEQGVEDRLKFEASLPGTLKFVNLIDSKKSELKFEFESKMLKANREGKYEDAQKAYQDYVLKLGDLDRVLSLQVTSEGKQKRYDSFLNYINTELESTRSRIAKLPLNKESSDSISKKVIVDEDDEPPPDRDVTTRDTKEPTYKEPIITKEIPIVGGGSRSLSFGKRTWQELGPVEGIISKNNGDMYLIVRSGSKIEGIKLKVVEDFDQFLKEHYILEQVIRPSGEKIDELFKNLNNHKKVLEKTPEGREIVQKTETLQLELKNSEKSRDEVEDKISERIERHRSNRTEPPQMPPPPSKPSGNTDSGAIAQDIILNILYYGSALSYPIGSAVEAVELICAMIYNVDLFGNEVDNVDKMIIALGILLPHVTKIPGVKQTLKAMISYLKKAGVPAKNALLRIFKKGKEATVKLFADAEKGASHGLNIFDDLGGDFLESAGEIVESAQALGIKAKEEIFKLSKAVTSTKASPFDLKPTHRINPSGANYKNVLEQLKSDKQMRETIKYVEFKGEKYIVDGHHRVRAAKELKMEKIPIEEVKLPYQGYKTIEDLF